jgi:TRAP-type C4-dicarboxylate transport system substrate-binding protein
MNLMKTALRTVAATAILAGMSASAFAQEVTLKMHQFLPAQANVPKLVLDVWADKIEADSQGRIKIERYPSMQLGGKPPELADQVIDGVADIVWTVSGYTPGRFPQSEAFELPFTISNAEDSSRAYWQYAEANMMDKDFKDLHMLGAWVHGPGVIHSNTPITLPADLNGVKLRAPTRMTNMLFGALGATPVGMPVPAVPEALSKGVIDATIIPWEVTAALKTSELVKNHTEFGAEILYTTTFIFAMNKDKYAALPDDLKAVIDANSGEDFSAFAGKTMEETDAPARQMAVDLGNNIITLTPEQAAEWKAASADISAGWVKEMNDLGFDGQALVDQARDLIAKNSM